MSKSLKKLEMDALKLVAALKPVFECEVVEINEKDEDIGQDHNEVVIQWCNPVYKGSLNEMVYYMHLTKRNITCTMDVCVDEKFLFDIVKPNYDDIAGLANSIYEKMVASKG